MRHRVLIIADDLSGAADCGMAFASSHLDSIVVLGDSASDVSSDVLSIDADTRRLDPQQAQHKIARLMREFCGSGVQIVFKKLDSTLRGNVGAELASVLQVRRELFPSAVAVLAPAFPANGRTTVGGKQLLHGTPLEDLEIWRREGRRGTSYIPAIVKATGLRTALLSLETVRSTEGGLRIAMSAAADGADVLICDAETDQDLCAISEASVALGSGTVWTGSAGLAYHLPKAARLTARLTGTRSEVIEEPLAVGPTLFVIGSPARRSHEQARILAACSGTVEITIPAEDLTSGTQANSPYERRVAEALGSGQDVIVSLGQAQNKVSNSQRLCSVLAKMLAPHANDIGALVATGGETARAVLQAFGVNALRLVKELEAGVPFCVTENWRRCLPVVTKAGDFGTPETLLRCREFLSELDRTSCARKVL